ncbi:bifunctional oligoribonuclease/PAP phosphatase NrnA [soil metagenome]
MKAGFSEIASALQGAGKILVASHIRPDADALGSTIAFTLWLRSLGKDVMAWNQDGVTPNFRYLPEHGLVSRPSSEKQAFDVVVALDNSVKNRLGSVVDAIEQPRVFINMDHHVSNEGYGDLNYIDPTSPATGQILFEFFQDQGVTISPEMAANLYAAISTDTGSFQYAGTDSRTFAAASGLVVAGVQVAELSRQMYENYPRRRVELLRHALNDAKYDCEDRVVSFALPLTVVHELSLLPEDNEGIIDHLRAVEGVVAAVFFEELPDGKVRVSARSKDPRVDVCKICGQFGGGGHPLAAGARIAGSLAEVQEKFLKAVCHEIRN